MNPSLSRPKTVICDLDGVVFVHRVNMTGIMFEKAVLLPGAIEKFNEWDGLGYNIILMTGRHESSREATERELRASGLFWDQLVMGVGGGQRVLINDVKPYDPDQPTAVAINLKRGEGLGGVKL
jgi:hypothetical protein